VDRRIGLWKLCMGRRGGSCVLATVVLRLLYGWKAAGRSSEQIVDAGKRDLLGSEKVSEETFKRHLVYVFDLPTGLTAASIEVHLPEPLSVCVHSHLDNCRWSGEDGGTKAVGNSIKHFCREERDVLEKCSCWCNAIRQALTEQIKEANQISQNEAQE